MDFSQDLTSHLNVLTAGLEDGSDLQTILSVLFDDLSVSISSFAGLSITLRLENWPFTLTALNTRRATTSMMLPLAPVTAATSGSTVVFYAENPGAFVDLAADANATVGRDGDAVLDRHLPAPAASESVRSLTALAERSTVDQALGFLIEQGYTTTEAADELKARAETQTRTVPGIDIRDADPSARSLECDGKQAATS